jgi:NADH:ubiquinone oxidoreductase subunit K
MKRKIYSLFLALTLIETILFSVYLIIKNFSGGRIETVFDWLNLVFLVLVILIGGFFAWLLAASFRKDRDLKELNWILSNTVIYWTCIIFLSLIFVEAFQDILYFQAGLKERYYPIFLMQNQPLMAWASLVAGQSLLGLIIMGWKMGYIHLPEKRDRLLWLSAGLVIGFTILFSGSGGSLPTNAPVTFLHVLVVGVAVIGGSVLLKFLRGKIKWLDSLLMLDVLPFLVLWMLAFLVWSGAKIETNYFIDPPRPPNQIYTPTSDAIYYEIQSQRLLIGEGFEDKAQHSLYTYILAGLHGLGGDQYLDIVPLQIAILALIPFFLFKLTSRLGSPLAGWLVSLLFILREHTALLLGDTITVSNVQVLMTEPMATLGVMIVLYLGILWLEDCEHSRGLPLLIGSAIGLVVLIRVELISLAIALVVISFLTYWRRNKGWFRAVLVMSLTIGLVITPWIVRNYQKTGTIRLDKSVVLQWAVNRYTHPEEQEQLPPDLEENPSPGILQRINYKNLLRIANHTGSSLQQSLLYLPSNHLAFGGLDTYIKIVPEKKRIMFEGGIFSDGYATTYTKTLPYWDVSWNGSLTARTAIPVIFVILMITTGIATAWEKQRWVGTLPLLLMVTHIGIYAFFIGSGGRYIQVVDWVTLLYFSIGLWQTLVWIGEKLEIKFLELREISPTDLSLPEDRNWGKVFWGRAGLAGLCFLVALSMPVVESNIPKQYDSESLIAQIESIAWENSPIEENEIDIDQGLSDTVYYGKALYPGYFEADEFIEDDRAGRVPPPGDPRVVFYLVGAENLWISIPTDQIPVNFNHGVSVLIAGQLVRDSQEYLDKKLHPYFLAEKVLIFNEDTPDAVLLVKSTSENH